MKSLGIINVLQVLHLLWHVSNFIGKQFRNKKRKDNNEKVRFSRQVVELLGDLCLLPRKIRWLEPTCIKEFSRDKRVMPREYLLWVLRSLWVNSMMYADPRKITVFDYCVPVMITMNHWKSTLLHFNSSPWNPWGTCSTSCVRPLEREEKRKYSVISQILETPST